MFNVQINERGQITIPKELREKVKFKANDTLKLDVDLTGRITIYKSDFFDDLDDLIKKDLINEGFSEEDFPTKLPEKKLELAKSLFEMVSQSKEKLTNADYKSLESFKQDLKDEGLLD